jgi:transposase
VILVEHQSLYFTDAQRRLLITNLQNNGLPKLNQQRIRILLLTDEGKTQTEICKELGCSPSTARHWMHMARTGMAHLWQDFPRGRPKIVTDTYLKRLKELLNENPRDYKYPFRRWTADWLRKHLASELGIEISLRHFKRLLKEVKQTGVESDPEE